jgi:hypothetical protein
MALQQSRKDFIQILHQQISFACVTLNSENCILLFLHLNKGEETPS